MPRKDQTQRQPEGGLPDGHQTPDQGRSAVSRRSLLGAAGVGAAGLAAGAFGGLAVAPSAAAATRPSRPDRTEPVTRADHTASDARPDPEQQVVVHVRNVRSGEIDIFAGTSETRVHDPELAARLAREIR
jgi:hypothetical protein